MHGLEQAGLVVHDCLGDLSSTIFLLSGFSQKELSSRLYEFYFQQIENWLELPREQFNRLVPVIAQEIYTALQKEKRARHSSG